MCNINTPILTNRFYLASAGAELNLNLGVLSWDAPYRFRIGLAAPLHDGALFGQTSGTGVRGGGGVVLATELHGYRLMAKAIGLNGTANG